MRAVLSVPVLLLTILPRPAAAGEDRWMPLGPEGGTILALAADPGAPGTLYAGAAGSGVWKSTDGGGHWLPASQGLGSLDAYDLATSPGAPGTVWAATRGGVYKSADGGATWQRVWYQVDQQDDTYTPWTRSIAVDPTDPGVAWAGTLRGWVLKTTDGGESWEQVLDRLGITNLLIDPTHPSTVYASSDYGLYKTGDGGATWERLHESTMYALAMDPSDPRVLYANGYFNGVWKSTDGGATWSPLPGFGDRPVTNLFVDPFHPSVVLAGTFGGLWQSEDAGVTWHNVPGLPAIEALALEADPVLPGRIWLGTNDRGVFRSLDAGRTWRTSRQGLAASSMWAVAFDPVLPRTLYAVAGNTGVHRSTDGGRTWSRINAGLPKERGSGVLAATVAPHPLRPGTLFAGTGEGLFRSPDRGAHWSRILDQPFLLVLSVAVDPRKPGTIFAGGDVLFRTRDGGRTWKRLPLTSGEHHDENEITEVITDPRHPGWVYVLDFDTRHHTANNLFRSTDGGDTWKLAFSGRAVALALPPTLPDVLYLATDFGEIWQSRDGGLTWERTATGAGGGAPPTSLVVDRLDPSILYLGTDGNGVWRSRDQGATWEPLNEGLIAPRITCLEADPRDRHHLIACTEGGGLLEIRLQS